MCTDESLILLQPTFKLYNFGFYCRESQYILTHHFFSMALEFLQCDPDIITLYFPLSIKIPWIYLCETLFVFQIQLSAFRSVQGINLCSNTVHAGRGYP